jgi:hypothetical protein
MIANEFFIPELAAECAAFSVPIDQFVSLSERVSQLERQISSGSNPSRRFEEELASQEQGVENLRLAVEKLQVSLKAGVRKQGTPVQQSGGLRHAQRSKVEIPMGCTGSLEGIIAALTKMHRGNVHEKGIVTISAKSVHGMSLPQNCADLTSDRAFYSEGGPGQWICWDFGKMRLHVTNYTIRLFRSSSESTWTHLPTSWVLEGSLDGGAWTEISRQTGTSKFVDSTGAMNTASFPVSDSSEFRFLRLTQAAENADADHHPLLHAVEFFGTLFQ